VKRLVFIAVLGAVALSLGGTASGTTRPPFPGDKLDIFSAPVDLDLNVPAVTGGGGITGTGSPPRIGPNVRANAPQAGLPNGLFGRSETTLTVHGNNVVAGWNDAQGFCGPPFGAPCTPQSPAGLSGYAYSTDGGATWTDGGAPDPFGGVFSRGDPWMDDNGSGKYYYANLAINQTTGAGLGVGVWRGGFQGQAFSWSDVKTFNSPNAPDDFYDKEAIVAGKNQFKNDAYVSLTNFIEICGMPVFGFGQIEVWRTHDGGATWQGPAIAGPEQPDSVAACGFTGTLQQSSAPAIGANGDVYVAWQVGPTFNALGQSSADADIVVAKSTDGGATFAPYVKVADINSSRANPPIGYNRSRVNDHPRIDVATTGKYKGRVYVTYYDSASPVPSASVTTTQQVLVDIQTYLKYSDDGGATWSAPMQIGGPIPSTKPAGVGAIKRWWPDVTVGPGGDVHVVYYEEVATDLAAGNECPIATPAVRNGPYSSLLDTWWTYSQDGGASWSMPLKLSEQTSNVCRTASNIRPNLGDYIDAEAFGGNKVAGFWAGGPNFDPANPAPATTPVVPIDAIIAVGKG